MEKINTSFNFLKDFSYFSIHRNFCPASVNLWRSLLTLKKAFMNFLYKETLLLTNIFRTTLILNHSNIFRICFYTLSRYNLPHEGTSYILKDTTSVFNFSCTFWMFFEYSSRVNRTSITSSKYNRSVS